MKRCIHEGRKSKDGSVTCNRDGSRRRAGKSCGEKKCPNYKPSIWERMKRRMGWA